jgi:heparan-alpha-glucosaminide N-acetyltransferase
MITAVNEFVVESKTDKLKSERIKSIDIFRGLTILAMVFVNDVAGVTNIPGWLKHMPADADGMTFVDLVFPAFLFIVGMAIPYSINKRIQEGYSLSKIAGHILTRTGGLLVLGILMVNMSGFNQSATGMSKQVWIILVFLFAIITWNSYPKKSGNEKLFFSALRFFGAAGLIILAVIYRGGTDERWLQTSWWGILGLIGWAYLASSMVYLFFRKYPSVIIASIFLFSLSYLAEKNGLFNGIYEISGSLLIGMQLGSHASIALAGIFLSQILLSEKFNSAVQKVKAMFFYSLILLMAGALLHPLYGINKNLATPAWCFYSGFFCVIIFILLYLLVDYKKYERWSHFLRPAGTNPLLAYILPSIFYALLSLAGVSFYSDLADGIIGILRSLIFTLFILGVTYLLTRMNIKLHL